MRISSLRILVLAVAMVLAASLMVLLDTNPARAAIPQGVVVYDVVIEGTAEGLPFQRPGVLVVAPTQTAVTTNGVNPVDICLVSGNPGATPETGAIWLNTNSACVNSSATLDMAFVAVDPANDLVQIQPDPNISAVGINNFNINSGLLANVYYVQSGLEQVQFLNGGQTVIGAIDVIGSGFIFASQQRYTATFTGTARNLPAPPQTDVSPPPSASPPAATPPPPSVTPPPSTSPPKDKKCKGKKGKALKKCKKKNR